MFDDTDNIPTVNAEPDVIVKPTSFVPVEQPEVEQNIPQEQPKPEPQPEQLPPQQESWKNLRDKADRMERERNEALLRAQAYEQMIQQKQNPPQDIDDDFIKIADDDLVDGKHLSARDKQIKKIQEENKRYQEQLRRQQEQLTETQIRLQYPDFDKVVNPENLRILGQKNPALAASLQYMPDLKTQASSAYEFIKQFGIDTAPTYNREKELVQNNASKPKPSATISAQRNDSPVYQANAFADGRIDAETKSRLWKEMQECARNRD